MLAHLLCGLRMKLDEPEARSARSAAVGSAFQFLCFYRRGERVKRTNQSNGSEVYRYGRVYSITHVSSLGVGSGSCLGGGQVGVTELTSVVTVSVCLV